MYSKPNFVLGFRRPVGEHITVQVAQNRAFTNYSYGGKKVSEWGDGGHYDYDQSHACITAPNLHTVNYTDAAGTALAISYTVCQAWKMEPNICDQLIGLICSLT
jgi:hypothetical protein